MNCLNLVIFVMLILHIIGKFGVIVLIDVDLLSSFLCLLANLTKPSKYSNSLGIIKITSTSVKDILPLMKWIKILDLNVTSFSNPILIFFFLDDFPSSKLVFSSSLAIVPISNFLLGALVCENKSWLAPQILSN